LKKIICIIVVLSMIMSMSAFALEPDSYTFFDYFKYGAEKEITSEITSVTIRKVNTELEHDERQTTNKEQLAKFTEIANTITLKRAEVNDTISWGDGMYIEVAFGDYVSYSYISADGGVDNYSIFMSRLPIRAYQFDVAGNAYRMISEFFDGIDNNIFDWAALEVENAIELGILPEHLQNGYLKNTTRERFCEVINGMIQLDGLVLSVKPSELLEYGFDDCKNPAVVYLHNLGIVFGKGNGIFDPDGLLTRQEAATILYRLMKQYDLGYEIINTRADYGDIDQVADWALEGVNAVSDWGIMKGDGINFMPKDKYTHQQAIVTIMRLHKEIVNSRQPVDVPGNPRPIDFSAQIIETRGYNKDAEYSIITTINSVIELNSYYNKYKDIYNLKSGRPYHVGFVDAIERYDDDYFNNSCLVMVVLHEASGTVGHKVEEVRTDGKIVIKGTYPGGDGDVTMDTAEWHVVIEIPKEYSNLTYTL